MEATTTDREQEHHAAEEEVRRGPRGPVDRQVAPTRTGLIVPEMRGSANQRSPEARQAEFEGLA